MSGYWVVRGKAVKDEAALKEYGRLWAPLAEKYGARIIAGRGRLDTREGPEYGRSVLVEFPSFEAAVACYEDPEYQKALPFAKKAYARELAILEGS